jgi:KipI family sensor histidine kinase inhibitor
MRGTFGASGDIIIYPRFLPVGDSALSVELGDVIDAGINALVRALDRAIAAANIPGIIETVPSFRALMVIYEPEEIDPDTLIADLKRLIAGGLNAHAANARSWTVPVAYGVPVDDDLREVAAATGLSCDEVVAMHSGADYQVYVIGFVPGLPVLGGLPAPLHLSRRPEHRQGIPAGSVMIGGMQGLIVPMTMPSGWYTLGQTPLRPFNPGENNPFLFRLGDRIRFRPITARELDALAGVSSDVYLDNGT